MDAEIERAAETFRERTYPEALQQDARRVEFATVPDKLDAECPDNPEPLFTCPRYKLIVTSAICGKCKADGKFRQSLYANYIRNRAARALICEHRGKPIETLTVACCGGKRTVNIGVYPCKLSGRQVAEPDCWLCDKYKVAPE